MKLLLKDSSIESVCGIEFPSVVDGYIHLVECGDAVEVRRYSFGDSHPWKDYKDSERVIKFISKKAASELVAAVESLNSEFDAKVQAESDLRANESVKFSDWLESLPSTIGGLEVSGGYLVDSYGNELISLSWSQVAHKEVSEIESFIETFFEEGGCE